MPFAVASSPNTTGPNATNRQQASANDKSTLKQQQHCDTSASDGLVIVICKAVGDAVGAVAAISRVSMPMSASRCGGDTSETITSSGGHNNADYNNNNNGDNETQSH